MEAGIKSKKLHIGGMTCVSCQNRIEKALLQKQGIKSAKVSYRTGNAEILYDSGSISPDSIVKTIEELDYRVLPETGAKKAGAKRTAGILLMIAALYLIVEQAGLLNYLVPSRLAEAGMDYGMLFVIGLITSVHCVAMCGGINLSQCLPRGEGEPNPNRVSALLPSFLYNLGRVVSYTVVGFVVGAFGSAFTFSSTVQGILKLMAGVFMVVMGINMLDIFPWMRKLVPTLPGWLGRKARKKAGASKSPLIVGLLNGLMPCGPLQAMQLYALSTGSPFQGALSMLIFSLGTLPLMFGLGALGTFLTKKSTHKIMTAGAVLVVVLGLSMFSQGWSLSGFALPPVLSGSSPGEQGGSAVTEDGVQLVQSTLSSGRYPSITVEAGTPVKWVITAPKGSVNGCNNRIYIPQYGIEYQFHTGENVIEFTPDKTGKFQYSCWMGMIRGTITVAEPGSTADSGGENAGEEITKPVPAGYVIPTEQIEAAAFATDENGETFQQADIVLNDQGFSPAVIVVQAGVKVIWNIYREPSGNTDGSELLVPFYSSQLPLSEGDNSFYLYPTESFDFSTGDNAFYGYVKVVEEIADFDEDAVRQEVNGFETRIWPPETFSAGGGGSCCQ